MTALAEQNENIYLVPEKDYNIISYYPCGDLMISDISSTIFEFSMISGDSSLLIENPIPKPTTMIIMIGIIIFEFNY